MSSIKIKIYLLKRAYLVDSSHIKIYLIKLNLKIQKFDLELSKYKFININNFLNID